MGAVADGNDSTWVIDKFPIGVGSAVAVESVVSVSWVSKIMTCFVFTLPDVVGGVTHLFRVSPLCFKKRIMAVRINMVYCRR